MLLGAVLAACPRALSQADCAVDSDCGPDAGCAAGRCVVLTTRRAASDGGLNAGADAGNDGG